MRKRKKIGLMVISGIVLSGYSSVSEKDHFEEMKENGIYFQSDSPQQELDRLWSYAGEQELPRGIRYIFSPEESGEAQVKRLIEQAPHLLDGELQPIIEIDSQSAQYSGVTQEVMTAHLLPFLVEIESILGVKPIISLTWHDEHRYGNSLKGYHRWVHSLVSSEEQGELFQVEERG